MLTSVYCIVNCHVHWCLVPTPSHVAPPTNIIALRSLIEQSDETMLLS